jgi:hypothetical protein
MMLLAPLAAVSAREQGFPRSFPIGHQAHHASRRAPRSCYVVTDLDFDDQPVVGIARYTKASLHEHNSLIEAGQFIQSLVKRKSPKSCFPERVRMAQTLDP